MASADPTAPDGLAEDPHAEAPLGALALRAALGGALMGLANLVPGISGGTMLLAAGVYPAFIGAIAQLTTLKIRLRPVLLLGVVGGAAAVAILLLAGATKTLVVEQRNIMKLAAEMPVGGMEDAHGSLVGGAARDAA